MNFTLRIQLILRLNIAGLGAARVLQQSTDYPNSGAFFDANQGDTSTFVALLKAADIDPRNLQGTIIVPENKVSHGQLATQQQHLQ